MRTVERSGSALNSTVVSVVFAPRVQLMVVAVLTIVDGVYKDSSKEDRQTAQLIVR